MAEGTQLGKYTLKRQLATGGMAEIWLGEQRGPGGFTKELVVKRILPHLANDEKFVQMFLDEARLAAQLTHPNIVQIFDLGEADGSYFIAMEYIRGHDLAQLREAGRAAGAPLDWLAAARIVADACAGLDYAHNFSDSRGRPMNLVHRDVSPQNILVSDQGAVKLVDFGVAKAATSTHKTQTGAVKGKFAYMSPEQIRGEKLDGRSDLFAMGIVLFEMLTGRRPFGADSELLALTAIMHHPAPDVQEINPNVPQAMRDIVAKALEKSADDRFQSAEAMQSVLEVVLARSGQPVGRKTLATYISSLLQGAPIDLSSGVGVAHTMADGSSGRMTEQGVPFSLRHGPADQPTRKQDAGPSLFERQTRQMAPDQEMAGRDTQTMTAKRGVSGGLLVAITMVFLALAGAGYYLYTTVSGKGESEPVATGSGDSADAAEGPDAGDEDDTGLATGPNELDAGPASTDAADASGALAQQTDAGDAGDAGDAADDAGLAAVIPEAGAAPLVDAGLVAQVDTSPGPTTQPLEPDLGPPGPAADAGIASLDASAPLPIVDTGPAPTAPDAGPVATADAVESDDAAVIAQADAEADIAEEDDVTVALVQDAGQTEEEEREVQTVDRDRPGRVRIRVTPRGRYEILVDGEVVGRTPIPAQMLSPGRHRIGVRRVGESHTVRQTVRVRPGSTQTVRITFE